MGGFVREYYLYFPYFCKICNKEIKSKSGLGSHIKNQHKDFDYESYLLKYENIDIEKQRRDWYSEENIKKRKQKQINGFNEYANSLGRRSPKERMSKETYKKWRNKMSRVFTLDWFMEKYGEKEGTIKYQERCNKISKQTRGHNRLKNNPNQYSKISQELFWKLYRRTSFKNVYFGELNHEYGCETPLNFDFVVLDNKKIIEFNGDKWHANPKMYEENDVIMPTVLNKKAKQIWKEDILKNNKAIKNGYQIKIIWESDYCNDKDAVILEALSFLLQ